MMRKDLLSLYVLILLGAAFSCDTTPADKRDNYNISEEEDYRERNAEEQVAPGAIAEVEGSQVIVARLSGVGNEDMAGKVSIFTPQNEDRKIQVELDNLNNENYDIYISELTNCAGFDQLPDDIWDEEKIVAEVNVDADGTGLDERNLYSDQTTEELIDKAVIVFNELGEVVGCGVFKND